MTNSRKIVFEALIKIEEGGYSNIVISNALDKNELSDRDRAFSSALFYGVLERAITLDKIISEFSTQKASKLSVYVKTALRMGIYQLVFMDKIPDSAAVNESVNLVKRTKASRYSGFVNGVLRNISRTDKKKLLDFSFVQQTDKRLSFEYSVPDWMAGLFVRNYGESFTRDMLCAFNGRNSTVLRVNTLKIRPEDFVNELINNGISAEISDICKTAVIVEGSGAVDRIYGYNEGLFHVQDTASQLCCEALGVKPGMRLLDICAAPGGKSFTLAENLKNDGEILSLDLHESKLPLITGGARRLGITCIKTFRNDATVFNGELGLFDAVLCDAPCSGLGIIAKKPEIRYKNVAILDFLSDMQYVILCNASRYVKRGGRLVYSTCTLNPEENERTAERFLSENREFKPVEILPHIKRAFKTADNMLTLFPNIHDTDGFFISAFERK